MQMLSHTLHGKRVCSLIEVRGGWLSKQMFTVFLEMICSPVNTDPHPSKTECPVLAQACERQVCEGKRWPATGLRPANTTPRPRVPHRSHKAGWLVE